MKRVFICLLVVSLSACGNPGGISDEDYAKYKALAAPKILYSCKPRASSVAEIGSVAGIGIAVTYNKLLRDAERDCDGEFKILDSKS